MSSVTITGINRESGNTDFEQAVPFPGSWPGGQP